MKKFDDEITSRGKDWMIKACESYNVIDHETMTKSNLSPGRKQKDLVSCILLFTLIYLRSRSSYSLSGPILNKFFLHNIVTVNSSQCSLLLVSLDAVNARIMFLSSRK